MDGSADRVAEQGLTRREILKRGAALGGTLLWATPAVQVIGVGRAAAQETSPDCIVYCIKYEVDEGRWVELGRAADNPGRGRGEGNCLICPEDAVNGLPPNIGEFTVTGDPEVALTVCFPASCSLADPDPSPDEFFGGSAAAKCGSQRRDGDEACNFVDPGDQFIDGEGNRCVRFEVCANGRGISNIQMIIVCCE